MSQYGLRLRTREFESVGWDEFKALLAGTSPESALGRVVAIRAETDEDAIRRFGPDQRRIYDDWRDKAASATTPQTYAKQMARLEQMMAALAR